MQPSAFSSDFIPLTASDQQHLLEEAREAIKASAYQQHYSGETLSHYSSALQQTAAAFVTLTIHGELRGCIGSLEAHRPLIKDVISNAQAAASRDPRFLPLIPDELNNIHIEISVLSPPQPVIFTSESDLLSQIIPFEDGLILEDGQHRGTFLPLVWESLPDKQQFLQQLKRKAGLPEHYWSDSIKIKRYRTLIFEETSK